MHNLYDHVQCWQLSDWYVQQHGNSDMCWMWRWVICTQCWDSNCLCVMHFHVRSRQLPERVLHGDGHAQLRWLHGRHVLGHF